MSPLSFYYDSQYLLCLNMYVCATRISKTTERKQCDNMKNYLLSCLLQLYTAPDKHNEIIFCMSQSGPAEMLPCSIAMWVEFCPQFKWNKRLDVNTARAALFPQTWPAHSAVNLRFLSADNIHSDRCRVPLDSLLCLTVTPSTRSLWTDTHTHSGSSDEHDLKCPVCGGAAA